MKKIFLFLFLLGTSCGVKRPPTPIYVTTDPLRASATPACPTPTPIKKSLPKASPTPKKKK